MWTHIGDSCVVQYHANAETMYVDSLLFCLTFSITA